MTASDTLHPISVESLRRASVPIPAGVFMLGHRYEDLSADIRESDRVRGLGLGSLLDATPPHWVWLPDFSMSQQLVTNGDYLSFLHATASGSEGVSGAHVFDDSTLWRYVWSDTNARVGNVRIHEVQPDGSVLRFEESYTGAHNFIDAYLASIAAEVDRMLHSDTMGPDDRAIGTLTQRFAAPRDKTVRRVFSWLRWKLRHSILGTGKDDLDALVADERERSLLTAMIDHASTPQQIDGDLDELVRDLQRRYVSESERSFVSAFRRDNQVVETVLFLRRARKELAATPATAPLALHRVLYPRSWSSPDGDEAPQTFGATVPWSEQPVTGVCLYESLAFTAWLSSEVDWQIQVTLPNEAEFERVAGWPLNGEATQPTAKSSDGSELLDPRLKQLYPWQDQTPRGYFEFFGTEGHELENYRTDREAWARLVEETARLATDQRRLSQLVGFGWQWMADRFDTRERKYERFNRPDYPRHSAPAVIRSPEGALGPIPGDAAPVFDYQPNRNPQDSYYVVRGAPDLVGGPGICTRRYALLPLRGYHNVGFRWVIHG